MRKLIHNVILFIGILLLAGSCSNGVGSSSSGEGDWTSFRGKNTLSGSVDIALPKEPQLLWATTTGQRTVASPLVKDGIIYTVGRRGLLRAVAEEFDSFIEATPLIVDTMMYIGTIDGYLMAMGLSSHEIIWHYWTEGQISSPPMETSYGGEDAIVFGSYDNFLYTIAKSDGKTLSKFETGYYLNGATAVKDGYLSFGGCDQWLRVIDTKAGIQSDSLLLDAYLPSSPVFSGKEAYIGDYSGNIYKFLLDEGKISESEKIHSAEASDEAAFVGLPAVGKDNVYYFTRGRYLTCASRKDGSVKWETMLKGTTGESSPEECRNGILVCTKTGIVSILDKSTGEVKWEYDTGEDILTCPAIVPGRFYILTAKGTLLCFGNK